MAKNFQKEFDFPGSIFVDENKTIYKALGTKRGLQYVLSPLSLQPIAAAFAEGYTQSNFLGDSLQLGGIFLISLKGGILFEHIEKYAGHEANMEELLSICQKVRNENV